MESRPQSCHTLTVETRQAIGFLCDQLRDVPAVWAITGSAALALHDLETVVGDIDVQSDATGIYLIEKAIEKCMTRKVVFSSSPQFQSHFGRAQFQGLQIELMGSLQKRLPDGNWEPPVDVGQHREFHNLDGRAIPIMSMAYLEAAYVMLGRSEKVRAIRRGRATFDV